MKRILLTSLLLVAGYTQAQVKTKSQSKTKAAKQYVNPVKLTKEERARPYMDEVLKTRDHLTPEEAERRRKNIEAGNPFKKYGYYPKVATLSKGKYLEFHDKDSIVSIGSVRFNRKTKEIVEFREIDLNDPDAQPYLDTAGRWFSPDPLSEEYSSWSPYHIVYNNPISNIDPDGMQIFTDYKLLKDGTVTRVDPNDGSEKRNDDRLYATDKNGNVTNTNPLVVDKAKPSDGTIISSLATNYGLQEPRYPKGINFGRTTNDIDAANVFMFAAKNSDVEWGLEAFKVGNGVSYTVFTGHDDDSTPPNFFNQSPSKSLFDIHSHKNVNEPSPINGLTNGDYGISRGGDNYYNRTTGRTDYPNHYLYYAPNKGKSNLWMYHWRNKNVYKKDLGTSIINLKKLGK